MRWSRVLPWVALLVFEFAVALRAGPWSALVYVAAALTGLIGAFVYIRRRAASGNTLLASEVEAGRLLWAARVRTVSGDGKSGDWGGTLRLYPDLEFRFYPDDWSGRHRAMPRTWASGTRLTFTDNHRDISGLNIQGVVLTPPHGMPVAFNAYGLVGALPTACVI